MVHLALGQLGIIFQQPEKSQTYLLAIRIVHDLNF
jgi:hypothetical protein